jgi:hypothetical protein
MTRGLHRCLAHMSVRGARLHRLLPPKSEFARVTNRLLPRRRQPPPTAATCAAPVRSPGKSPPPRAAHGLLFLLTRSLLPASPTTKTNQSPSPPVIRGSFFHYCCDLVLLGSWGLGRKLGVGQGHGVIRASDRALRGRVVGGQCCCSLGVVFTAMVAGLKFDRFMEFSQCPV